MMEWYWQGQTKILEGQKKTCPIAHRFTKNLKQISLGSNPGLRRDRPASDRMSHSASATAKQKHSDISSLEDW